MRVEAFGGKFLRRVDVEFAAQLLFAEACQTDKKTAM
jgi:hypothetical protein